MFANDNGTHAFMSYPRTYVQLQIIFLFIPLAATILIGSKPLLCDAAPEAKRGIATFLVFLLAIALVQGAAWDNYGGGLGIWVFDHQSMLGVFGNIPYEEYSWICSDTLLSFFFALRLYTEFGDRNVVAKSKLKRRGLAHWMILIVLAYGSLYGATLLISYPPEYFFLGISLAFFLPFVAWQWAHSSNVFLANWKLWLASWLIPGLFTYVADCVAVNQGIWVFDYDKFTSGIWWFGVIQPEVLLIYVIACVVCAQPALAVLGEYDVPELFQKKRV